jgi:hypothetical protein
MLTWPAEHGPTVVDGVLQRLFALMSMLIEFRHDRALLFPARAVGCSPP